MTADQIEALFTRADGSYAFARWGRPIAPIAFGVEDETLGVIKGAIEAVCTLAGHETTDMDPELGSNFMWFFFSDWDELLEVPGLDRLVKDLVPLVARLKAAEANQYRAFRFDAAGGIKACFVFVRMDDALTALPADTLVLGQVAQSIVLWSDMAFVASSPLGIVGQATVLRPDIAEVIRAAYDPVMPVAARDASHALRLAARMEVQGGA
ncbi:hypothetical protein [Pseudosulfitobacter koreensis]|uniref:Uncharacterized protein n=1 Tax=Pseudosulfitobacter koreensis TaxID=2968472 RepID=A0ABT1Z353_9RHOB|nr:hypothetical protein [Pseudosulfitobacter koreense]MCR8827545.1 hypothetical protein [Pseudosulfitobacter koreense]